MLILHGDPRSGNTRKVRWALEELGASYELRVVDLGRGEHKSAGFLALNPNGLVPVLDDDGFVVWESDAILWHLAETRGGLLPAEPRERAQVRQWMSWNAYELAEHTYGARAMRLRALRLGTALDRARHTERLAGAGPRLAILDRYLAERRFVVGDAPTIADVALATNVDFGVSEGVRLDEHAHVRGWFERMIARPARKQASPPPSS